MPKNEIQTKIYKQKPKKVALEKKEVYLLYEFVNRNYDEDILEEVEIIGIYSNISTALKKANERVKYGIEECNVVIDSSIKNKKNPFNETWCVEMCRQGVKDATIYSIIIKRLQVE